MKKIIFLAVGLLLVNSEAPRQLQTTQITPQSIPAQKVNAQSAQVSNPKPMKQFKRKGGKADIFTQDIDINSLANNKDAFDAKQFLIKSIPQLKEAKIIQIKKGSYQQTNYYEMTLERKEAVSEVFHIASNQKGTFEARKNIEEIKIKQLDSQAQKAFKALTDNKQGQGITKENLEKVRKNVKITQEGVVVVDYQFINQIDSSFIKNHVLYQNGEYQVIAPFDRLDHFFKEQLKASDFDQESIEAFNKIKEFDNRVTNDNLYNAKRRDFTIENGFIVRYYEFVNKIEDKLVATYLAVDSKGFRLVKDPIEDIRKLKQSKADAK